MEWFHELLFGSGIGHSILLLAVVIFAGILLGKIKIAGISLGITWILFVGIILSHFNMRMDPQALHFLKEFGLILTIQSGLLIIQVKLTMKGTLTSGKFVIMGVSMALMVMLTLTLDICQPSSKIRKKHATKLQCNQIFTKINRKLVVKLCDF